MVIHLDMDMAMDLYFRVYGLLYFFFSIFLKVFAPSALNNKLISLFFFIHIVRWISYMVYLFLLESDIYDGYG